VGLVGAAFAGRRAVGVNRKSGNRNSGNRNSGGTRNLWLAAATAAHAFGVVWLAVLAAGLPDPTAHAYAASTLALLVYAGFHAALGCVFALYGWWRSKAGYVSASRSLDLRIGSLWHDYTAVTGVAALLLATGMPWLVTL
jgi:cytochrome c oxidase subunit I+III